MLCGFETRDYEGETDQEEIGYEEWDDESDNSSEFDREEIEIALYSKLHFVPGDVDNIAKNGNENDRSTDMANGNKSLFDKYNTCLFYESSHRGVNCLTKDDNCPFKIKILEDIDKETKSPNQNEATKPILSQDQPVIISDSEVDSDSKYRNEIKTELNRKSGLSQNQAIDISDSESDIVVSKSNTSELKDFICIDSISNDSDSSTDGGRDFRDTISIENLNSVSSSLESRVSTSAKRQNDGKRRPLCDDMILDETLSDLEDVQFNVNKGQEKLLIKSLPVGPIVTNTEDDKWAISERDMQAKNPSLHRYYNPITVRCFNCREVGHISNACPKPKKCDICYLCGDMGHHFRNCPKSICYNCNAPADHIAKECPKPRRNTNQECHRCLMYGHIKSECPDQWRQYHRTTSYDHFKNTKEKQNPKTYCYNCASSKHFGFECSRNRMSRNSMATYPFVALYKDTLKFYNKRKQDFYEDDERPMKKGKKSGQNDSYVEQHEKKQKRKDDVKLHLDKQESSRMSKSSSRVKGHNSKLPHIKQKRTDETEVRSVKTSTKGTSKAKNLTVTVIHTTNKDSNRKVGSKIKHTAEEKHHKKGSSKVKDIAVIVKHTAEKDFPRTSQRTNSRKKKAQDYFNEDEFDHQAFNNKWWECGVAKKKRGASKKNRQKLDYGWERFSEKPYKSDRGFKRTHF